MQKKKVWNRKSEERNRLWVQSSCHHFIMFLCWLSLSPSSPMRSRTAEEAFCSKSVPPPLRLNLISARTRSAGYNTVKKHIDLVWYHFLTKLKLWLTLTLSQSWSLWVCMGCNTPHLCLTACFSCSLARLPHLPAGLSFFDQWLQRTPPGGNMRNYRLQKCPLILATLITFFFVLVHFYSHYNTFYTFIHFIQLFLILCLIDIYCIF